MHAAEVGVCECMSDCVTAPHEVNGDDGCNSRVQHEECREEGEMILLGNHTQSQLLRNQ